MWEIVNDLKLFDNCINQNSSEEDEIRFTKLIIEDISIFNAEVKKIQRKKKMSTEIEYALNMTDKK